MENRASEMDYQSKLKLLKLSRKRLGEEKYQQFINMG